MTLTEWWEHHPEPSPPEAPGWIHPQAAFPWVWRPLECRWWAAEKAEEERREQVERDRVK